MAFDFPSSPTTGQTYSISGGPTYVYNGTAWVVLTPGNQFNRTVFTATAGQTTFSMNYVVGAVDVYRNGVKLAPADFTATNGTSIVLANGCTVGDTVEVISYPMITYSDAVKRTGDTMTGALALPSGGLNVGSGQLSVDTSGRVLKPNQPAFSAYHTNDIYWNSFPTPITYPTTRFNIGNCYNTSTSTFTAPVSGAYLFSVNEMFMSEGSYGFIFLGLQVNNATQQEFMREGDRPDYATFGGSMIFNLSANDTVRVALGISGVDSGYLRGNISFNKFEGYLLG